MNIKEFQKGFLLFVFVTLAICQSGSLAAAVVVFELPSSTFGQRLQSTKNFEFVPSVHALVPGNSIVIDGLISSPMKFEVTRAELSNGHQKYIEATSINKQVLLLNLDGTTIYGSLSGNGTRYTISGNPTTGLQFANQNHPDFPVIDLSHDAMIPAGMSPKIPGIDQVPQHSLSKLNDAIAEQSEGGRSIIRMLFVHSAEFGSGFSSPTARINQLVSFTNSSLQRSGIDIEFTVAHIEEIGFNNNLTTSTTLSQVTNAQGSFNGVPALRDQHGADMVAVLSFAEGFSSNGVAWVNGSNPDLAFSSTRLSPNCCDSVFAHELGHNLGSGHERSSVNPSGASPCTSFNFTGYSCGHGNIGNGWGTIMSRLNSGVVDDVFSNPSLSCLGEPCGIAQGSSNSADNFASFNITRSLVAAFRSDPTTITPVPTTPTDARSDTVLVGPLLILLLED